MNDDTSDNTIVDRQFRHMAWANQALIARLIEQGDAALALTAPSNEWSAGRILVHLVNSANGYAARLEGLSRQPQADAPTTVAELPALAERLAAVDARLRAHAARPDGMAAYAGQENAYPRSTVLAQVIHHATEHRAQIAGALATNGNNGIDLDAIDLWEFTDAEAAGA
ncbi:MAG TPA: DinB family protein [Candidatus Limnocylindrales bacterium]|nr:DinB family protein [Candidatus Limnocylindrales bacterium]